MRKTSTSLFSWKGLKRIRYLPKTISLIKNWLDFLLGWSGIKDRSAIYRFRDNTKIKTGEGVGTGTVAGIFIIKQYGDLLDYNQACVVIDIGANIGAFSIYAVKRCRTAKVYAYEPESNNFNLLCENIKLNHFQKNIVPFKLAVCGKEGIRKLYIRNSPHHSVIPNQKAKNENYSEIRCTTLQKIFQQNRINNCDILKLDCEGAEYEILYNTPEKYFRKIRKIVLEAHPYSETEGHNQEILENFLIARGFKIMKNGENYGILHCIQN